jgi:hypothetical protein
MVKLSLINEENKEKSYYNLKLIVLMIITAIFSFILGFAIAKIFVHEKILGLSAYYSLGVSLLFFLSFFALESAFGHSTRILYASGEAVIMMLGFLLGRGGLSLGLGELVLLLVLVGFFILGRSNIFKNKEEMMKIHWQKMIKKGVSLVLTGLILFWSIGFGLAFWEKPDNGFFVTPKGLEKFLNYGNFLTKFYLDDFSWSMTVDNLMNNLAEKSANEAIEKTVGTPLQQSFGGITDIINQQKQILIEQNIASLRQKLSEVLNKPLTGQEKLAEVAYQWLFGKFQSIPENMKNYLMIALMLVLFITLKIFAPLISFVARFISFLIFEILMALGFADTIYEPRSKENIVVS